jgi:hypothetical protein
MNLLRVDDIIAGLEKYPDKYDALDVYLKDVEEVVQWGETSHPPSNWTSKGPDVYFVNDKAKAYVVQIKEREGVLRLRRPSQSDPATGAIVGGLGGAALSAAISRKPEAILGTVVVGMLVGALVAAEEPSRRVFSMKFDPNTRGWRAYSGALLPAVKQQLGVEPAVVG